MKVNIFIPCFIDQFYPQTGMNMVKVLEKCGCESHYNTEQTCCGQPAFTSGYWDHAKDIGEKFIREFAGCEYIIVPSASCAGYVKNYFNELFHNTTLHNESRNVRRNIYEFCDFLVNVLKVEDVGAVFDAKVTYHDSCSALREYMLDGEPRRLLHNVKGLNLIEMKETHTCCGFGGMFSLKFEPIAVGMVEQKAGHALKTSAEYIVSTDTSCLMHIESYLKKKNIPLKTMHIADVLAAGW